MDDAARRGPQLISLMPLVGALIGALTLVGGLAVTSTAGRIAIVVAIIAVGLSYSAAMLIRGRSRPTTR